MNRYILIDYYLNIEGFSRVGQISLALGDILDNVDDAYGAFDIATTDNFQYSTSLLTGSGGALMTDFEFKAQLKSNESGDSSFDTLILSYKNPLATANGKTGTLSFNVTYGV